ncbi:hypothetical protein C4577_02890 [Candidatus Parcubacteria bacterium]|nr:MAG: hypothetical protein C4577_02890 [Candidatus Parcubacteria bacterium]
MSLCECGCGSLVKSKRRFVSGHNSRVPNLGKTTKVSQYCECGCGTLTNPGCRFVKNHQPKGYKRSEEDKVKIREGIARVGRLPWSQERIKQASDRMTGENNPFYGKKHSEETLKRFSIKRKKENLSESTLAKLRKPKSEEHRRKNSESHKGKPGRKQTLEEKQKKSLKFRGRKYTKETKIRMSVAALKGFASGTRTSNSGSISGTYKGVIFRSSCELAFLMHQINLEGYVRADRSGLPQYKISYMTKSGSVKTYNPDYFVNGTLKEIKQCGFRSSEFLCGNFIEKERAAILFCEQRGWKFEVIEMPMLNKRRIIFPLRQQGQITLIPRYEKQYLKWLKTCINQ